MFRKYLYPLILLFLVALIILLYRFNLRIDSRYSDIMRIETLNLAQIQKVTGESGRNFLRLFQMGLDIPATALDSLRHEWIQVSDLNSERIENIRSRSLIGLDTMAVFNQFLSQRKSFHANVDRYFELLYHGSEQQARLFLVEALQPSFSAYQEDLDQFLLTYRLALTRYSGSITQETRSKSFFFLLLGISPAALILLQLAISLVVLLFIHHRLDDHKQRAFNA